MSSGFRNFVVTLIVSLMLFGGLSYFIINSIGGIFSGDEGEYSETDNDNELEPYESSSALDTTVNETPVSPVGYDDSFTILFVGTDYQPFIHNDYDVTEINKDRSGFPIQARSVNADSIMVMHADRYKNTYMFSTLPSSMQVSVDGAPAALCEIYNMKGIEYLKDIVHAYTGLNIDYYAAVSVGGMADIIDAVGGITYTVPVDMFYTDESQELEIALSKGNQKLNGEDAVNMLRYCSYTTGDVSRRQLLVQFAKAMFKKLATKDNLAGAAGLYTSLATHVETNFTLTDLTRHLEIIFAYPDFTSVELTYPGSLRNDPDGSYFEPDISSAITLYKDYR